MLRRYYAGIDPGGAGGTPAVMGAETILSQNATQLTSSVAVTGAAGATVTIQVTTYTVTNPTGQIKVNTIQVFLNSTFTVVLNGSGVGSYTVNLTGTAGATGTVVRAIFTIIGVSAGQIGSPTSRQISKVY